MDNKSKSYKFKFTTHLRQRYRERILHPKQRKISVRELDSLLGKEINSAKENKSVWNNTSFTTYLFERYGQEDYHFFTSDDTIFVTIKKPEGPWVAVTCYGRKDPIVNHFSKSNGY